MYIFEGYELKTANSMPKLLYGMYNIIFIEIISILICSSMSESF